MTVLQIRAAARRRTCQACVRSLILFRDWRRGTDDATIAVTDDEETVGNPRRPSICTDNDVHAIAVVTNRSNLHFEQVKWRAERTHHIHCHACFIR